MDASTSPSHIAVLSRYQEQFEKGLSNGEFDPLLYPRDGLVAYILIIFLLVPHHKIPFLGFIRWQVFAFAVCFQANVIRRCRSSGPAIGYLIGIVSAFSLMWAALLIVFSNPQRDFKRIQKRKKVSNADPAPKARAGHGDGALTPSEHAFSREGSTSRTKYAGSSASEERSPSARGAFDNAKGQVELTRKLDSEPATRDEYFWQACPSESVIQRLGWVLDLVTNVRGIGWNWQILGLPGPPPDVYEQLRKGDEAWARRNDPSAAGMGNDVYWTRGDLLRYSVRHFLVNYLLLDLSKAAMMKDLHFWMSPDSEAPAYLPHIIRESYAATRAYRLLLSLLMISVALQQIFIMGPIFFVGILGPSVLGVQAEAWRYPSFWGSYTNVFDRALLGWWGGWWHQTFRASFGAPIAWLFPNPDGKKSSPGARLLQLTMAFMMSGVLHACGSYAAFPPTRPLRGSLLFFALQPLGIALHLAGTSLLRQLGPTSWCPLWIRRMSNFIYTHAWLYCTAPLLLDDMSRAGVWLFEPVPVSLMQGLGFGVEGEGWWRWKFPWAHWHQGQHWWDSGLTF
ncbi:MAG: hypothetical protein M1815_001348 [Lichina confinis]|nr:MAG: hypothetical protein M1815_001348 [Lichina confinis]